MKKRSEVLVVVMALLVTCVLSVSVLSQVPKKECIAFETFSPSTNPNPWIVGGITLEVFDYQYIPVSKALVEDWSGWKGLHCNYRTRISLPDNYSSVEATLVHRHSSSDKRIEAYTANWTLVGTASMSAPQEVAETLKIKGKDIRWVVIEASQDETLLLRFCYSKEPTSSGCLGTVFIALLVIGGCAVHFRKK